MPYERITHKVASRLLTVHPRLLVALVALVGFVALQGSAAAADATLSGVDGVDGLLDTAGDRIEPPEFTHDEEQTTNPGP